MALQDNLRVFAVYKYAKDFLQVYLHILFANCESCEGVSMLPNGASELVGKSISSLIMEGCGTQRCEGPL